MQAVQEHITAQRQALGSHRKQAQLPAVVKGTAANDLQAVRQGHLFHKACRTRGAGRGVRRRGVKGQNRTGGHCRPPPARRPGSAGLHRYHHLIAADGIRCRQTAGLFGEAVVPQLGDGPAASRRGRTLPGSTTQGSWPYTRTSRAPPAPSGTNLQHHPVSCTIPHSPVPLFFCCSQYKPPGRGCPVPAGVLGNTAQESWWALCAALFSSCTVHHKKIPRPNGPGIVVEHSPQHSNLYAGISLLRSVRFKPRNGGTSTRFNPCS